ncbi:Translocase of chloroplast 159, chloroplastic [Linum perenne]
MKVEDQISIEKRVVLVRNTGTVRSQADSAYGANVEVRVSASDFPIGQDQSSLGLLLVKWRGDLALATNLHQMGCCLTTGKPSLSASSIEKRGYEFFFVFFSTARLACMIEVRNLRQFGLDDGFDRRGLGGGLRPDEAAEGVIGGDDFDRWDFDGEDLVGDGLGS